MLARNEERKAMEMRRPNYLSMEIDDPIMRYGK
jgi:hypothetical protein